MKTTNWWLNYRFYFYLLYVPIYLMFFFVVEGIVNGSSDYFVSYTPFDDKIPFLSFFVVFYLLWFPYMIGTTLYLLWKDKLAYERLMYLMMYGFTSCLIIYLIFPNGQNLRPDISSENDIFSKLVNMLYGTDTCTNVLPSIHVYGSLYTAVAIADSNKVGKWAKRISPILATLICLSTCFIKQHSILDGLWALILFLPIYYIVYYSILFKSKSRLSFKSLKTHQN